MAIKRDKNGEACIISASIGNAILPLPRWRGKRLAVITTGTAQLLAMPQADGSGICEMTAQKDCYIAYGGSGVVATKTIADDGSRFFLAGVQVISIPLDSEGKEYTHVSVLMDTEAGVFQLEEVV